MFGISRAFQLILSILSADADSVWSNRLQDRNEEVVELLGFLKTLHLGSYRTQLHTKSCSAVLDLAYQTISITVNLCVRDTWALIVNHNLQSFKYWFSFQKQATWMSNIHLCYEKEVNCFENKLWTNASEKKTSAKEYE